MNQVWPISRILLIEILADHINDRFVSELVWQRLGYEKHNQNSDTWFSTRSTPLYWSSKFPIAPQVIANRSASVHLTRSIPKEFKQSLKECLDFEGYKISELFPRRTRRSTVVNWLLAFLRSNEEDLIEHGPLPTLVKPPSNPLQGHPGDERVE